MTTRAARAQPTAIGTMSLVVKSASHSSTKVVVGEDKQQTKNYQVSDVTPPFQSLLVLTVAVVGSRQFAKRLESEVCERHIHYTRGVTRIQKYVVFDYAFVSVGIFHIVFLRSVMAAKFQFVTCMDKTFSIFTNVVLASCKIQEVGNRC